MGIFGKKSVSPAMTEAYASRFLMKFDSDRSAADVLEMILYISNGIFPMATNNYEPRFKSLNDFDSSAAELLGSLDTNTFPQFVQMMLFEPTYLNRFIEVSMANLKLAVTEMRDLLNHQIPLSAQTFERFAPISNKIDLLCQEFVQLSSDLNEYVNVESLESISEFLIESREFKVLYLEELQRSMAYLKKFRNG
jgi:hypothetical protein